MFYSPPVFYKAQPLSVGIFFACSPSENRNDVASARGANSSFFNDLQAAGARSNLVGQWGIGKRIGTVCQNSRWLPPRMLSCP